MSAPGPRATAASGAPTADAQTAAVRTAGSAAAPDGTGTAAPDGTASAAPDATGTAAPDGTGSAAPDGPRDDTPAAPAPKVRHPAVRFALRLARPAFVLAALVLAGFALDDDGHRTADQIAQIGGGRLALSLLAALAGLLASAVAWRALLEGLGGRIATRPALDVFFVGQLGKYLPGSVFAVLGQVQRAGRAGVSRTAVGAAALLTMVMNVVSGALVAAVVLPFADRGALANHPEILVVLPLGLALLHPRVLGPLLNRLLRIARRPPLPSVPSLRAIGGSLLASLVMWAFYGLHIWLLAGGLGARGGGLIALATGGYAFAWVVGFLVVIAPAGLGVREAALAVALRPSLSSAAAVAVSIVSRIVMTVADVLWALAGALIARRAARDGVTRAAAQVAPARGR